MVKFVIVKIFEVGDQPIEEGGAFRGGLCFCASCVGCCDFGYVDAEVEEAATVEDGVG